MIRKKKVGVKKKKDQKIHPEVRFGRPFTAWEVPHPDKIKSSTVTQSTVWIQMLVSKFPHGNICWGQPLDK